jgi:hypothetical protein
MTSNAPVEPKPPKIFTGMSEPEVRKLWRQGQILAALDLAMQDKAQQAEELEPAPATRRRLPQPRNGEWPKGVAAKGRNGRHGAPVTQI